MYRNKFTQLFLSFLLLAGSLFLTGAEKVLTVIQTADLHGAVTKNRIYRTAYLIDSVTRESGGKDASIRIDCGDLIQGSYAMTFPEWRSGMFKILNELHYDAFIPGNHDLEFGVPSLKEALASFSGAFCTANWQWKEMPARKDYIILHKNGLKVALIGLGYHAVYGVLRPGDKGRIRTLSVRNTLHQIMPRVMREKPHIILLALHAGEYTRLDKDYTVRHLVREFPQIDLVLTAHSHQESKGAPVWNNTLRIQAPALGKGIAVARFTYDTEKRAVTSLKTRLVFVDGNTPFHREVYQKMYPLDRIVKRASRRSLGNIPFALGSLRRGEQANELTRMCGKALARHTGAHAVFYTPSPRIRKEAGSLYENELFLLFPYEEQIGVLELDSGECYKVLSEQLKFLRKKEFQSPYGIRYTSTRTKVRSFTFTDTKPAGSGKWRCAFSSYALSGAGGRFPVLRRLAQEKKVTYYPEKIRDILRNHISSNYKK